VNIRQRPLFREQLLAIVLGLTDGIMTALTLASGRLVQKGPPIPISLAFRIAVGALLSGAFVFFVARYAELRGQLIRAERQLNLLNHGKLATTALGRNVLLDAGLAALASCIAAFFGALFPLITSILIPAHGLFSISGALVALAILGSVLARVVYGSVLRWSLILVLGGIVLAAIGSYLRIV
jgi:predicted membrane protein (TIGR00267 family)